MTIALALLLSLHAFTTYRTETALLARRSAEAWDPSLVTVARFAARHADSASIVAADWGFTASVYCLSNGQLLLDEPFFQWASAGAPQALRQRLLRQAERPVYLLLRADGAAATPYSRRATEGIIREVEVASAGRRLPLEAELTGLRGVEVRKYAPPADRVDGAPLR